ncbi:MAG TPA: SUF system NifU family Fe-S cluster assembly protein [Bacilli bacterium]|nr:SUF system NifU family Fe-S cluster assembly protein [Bacilli bacterium]
MDQNLKRSIIMDNYQNPKNKGLIDDDSYNKVNMNSDSCIDEIDLMVNVKDNIIKDIRFDGESCAICTSSTSIMIRTLIGKTVEEAINVLENFENMIEEKEYSEDVLEEAIVYNDIAKQPNRKKCALLSWWGVKKILNQLKKDR